MECNGTYYYALKGVDITGGQTVISGDIIIMQIITTYYNALRGFDITIGQTVKSLDIIIMQIITAYYYALTGFDIFVPFHSTQPTISLFTTTVFSDPQKIV